MFFGLKLDDIKVNGKRLNVCSKLQNPDKCYITIDSGTEFNSIPHVVASAFDGTKMPFGSDGSVECDLGSEIGDLTYIISGKEYTLHPKEFLIEQAGSFA
jgi:hypothetical protein